ncbi:MAG: Cyanoalanine nitrilase [uncultured Thermomicrobiales bacterium]|uniref:Cyanoalanine nitrilase n=1 Tax=uncultured Thermomicrobiales bacterium TaxID=1645740 RepID=A0A6J4UTC9_9BACT|nr:MAG: Cyanoalanine nitrilase [uncultured Thermomicrobiales bacterium]
MGVGWTTRVAVVQAAPVIMDREATIDKAIACLREAAAAGAQLVLFPEAFIPAYPRGLSFGIVVGSRTDAGRRTWARYHANAVEIPSPATDRLGAAVRAAGVHLAIGVIERDHLGGTLYCTLLYFGPDGAILGKHRKLKPTAGERLIWGEGDGSTMPVLATPLGRVGGLICWENYMPLARMAMYRKGVELYLAPTADARDGWQATVCHIALEGRCFVLAANQYVNRAMYPADLEDEALADLAGAPEEMCRGGSAIISPLGDYLAGPLWGQEGILYADLNQAAIAEGKFDFDVIGHYARDDIFSFAVDERPQGG